MTSHRLHKREAIVSTCRNELAIHVLKEFERHGLTEGEQLRVLSELYSDMVGTMAKYMIRQERHGRADVPGGLE